MPTISEQPPNYGLPVATRVLTPTGWRAMCDLVPGDRVVDIAGRAREVRRLVPCGIGTVAELELREGTRLAAGYGQLVPVEVGPQRLPMLRSTAQIAELVTRGVVVRIAPCDPVDMTGTARLPVNGYLLGLLLGDGALSSPGSVVLWTNEQELRDRAEQLLPRGSRFSDHPHRQARCTGWRVVGTTPGQPSSVLEGLRELGLSGCRSWEKRVPEIYRWGASTADRLAVVQGLLDSDGAVDLSGKCSFNSASRGLVDDLLHLVGTLGGRGHIHVRKNVTYSVPGFPGRRAARDSYRLTFRVPELEAFTLARKASRVRPGRLLPQWQIAAVREGSVGPLLALDVAGPTSTYLVDGFVAVTATSVLAASGGRVA